ncbi:hypothetical protein ABFA07_016683 [Porites harrisoni]
MDLYPIDFSDPQCSKGPCDRKAAQIKTHVKQYINQGHSLTTPADLKRAIDSDEGIAGVRVRVLPIPNTTVKTKGIKCEGISRLSNFEIMAAGVLYALKAYGIGAGNFRSWTSFSGIRHNNQFEWIAKRPGKGKFVLVKPRQLKQLKSHTDSLLKEGSTAEMTQQENANLAYSLLFPCPDDGCTKSYMYMAYGRLEQHTSCTVNTNSLGPRVSHLLIERG